MKRRLVAALFLTLFAVSNISAAERVELRFSWWGSGARHEATLEAIRKFEASHPGVTIKGEYMGFGGYLERLSTQYGSGSEADIVQMDWAWLATFSRDGNGFYNLLDAGDKVNTAAYDQKWLDMGMRAGKLNALPVSFTTRTFIWNKTTWDKAGLALPKTWEDWVNAGPVFREKLGDDYYPVDININAIGAHLLGNYLFQKTGRMLIDPATGAVGVTVEELEDALLFYRRLVDNHAVTSLATRAGASGDVNSQVSEQAGFADGKWAGDFTWDSSMSTSVNTLNAGRFEPVVGVWPVMANAANTGRVGRPAMVMAVSRNSKNPLVAAEFLSFLLTSPESAASLKTTRGVLLAKPAYAELERQNLLTKENLEMTRQLAATQTYTPSPFLEDPNMMNLIDSAIENLGHDKITARACAETLSADMARLLERLNR